MKYDFPSACGFNTSGKEFLSPPTQATYILGRMIEDSARGPCRKRASKASPPRRLTSEELNRLSAS